MGSHSLAQLQKEDNIGSHLQISSASWVSKGLASEKLVKDPKLAIFLLLLPHNTSSFASPNPLSFQREANSSFIFHPFQFFLVSGKFFLNFQFFFEK
jgi:hypothetical protein